MIPPIHVAFFKINKSTFYFQEPMPDDLCFCIVTLLSGCMCEEI